MNDKAYEYFKKNDYENACYYYQKSYEVDKNDIMMLFNYSRALIMNGEYENGIKKLKRVEHLLINYSSNQSNNGIVSIMSESHNFTIYNLGNSNNIDTIYSEIYLFKSQGYLELGDAEKSIINANKSLQYKNCQRNQLNTILARSHLMLGNYKESKKLFYYNIKNNISKQISYLNYGISITNLGEFENAEKLFERMIKEYPDFGEVYINLALVKIELGKTDEAIQLCDLILSNDPYQIDSLLIKGGIILNSFQQGQEVDHSWGEVAINCYKKAIEIDPNQAFFYSDLGLLQSYIGKQRESYKNIEKALKMEPNNFDVLSKKLFVLDINNKYDDIILHCDHIISFYPDAFPILPYKALSLASLNKFNEAYEIAYSLTERFPDNKLYLNLVKEIESIENKA